MLILALFRKGRCIFHVVAIFLCKTTRATTLPEQSTVHVTAILCSTNDVLDADDGTIHSFACPCGSGFAVFGSAYIESRKRRKRSAREKNRWTDTEEKILNELFGANEDKLRYRSFNSPEWQSIARQLQERCRRKNVESEKSAQQCKNKMADLTKKYKIVKNKLRTTGYGKEGDDEHEDKETESGAELIQRNFNDMDNILGNREPVNRKHVLESSSQHVDSSPEIDQDLLEKETLDEEMWAAARAQKERDTPARLALMALK